MGTKLVCFSLYGTAKKYLDGAVENARLMPSIYPGWVMRVYAADDVPTNRLELLGCEIVRMGKSHDHSGMLWRFLPIWEKGVDYVLFRDADSRLNVREKAAVEAWIASGKTAHCMHDHLHHRSHPLLGGMWGIRGGQVPLPLDVWTRYFGGDVKRVGDMHLLRDHIYPHVMNSILRHSSVEVPWRFEPFPAHAEWKGFVGQQHDNQGNPIWV